MVGCRSRRVRTFGRSSPFFGRPRLRLGRAGAASPSWPASHGPRWPSSRARGGPPAGRGASPGSALRARAGATACRRSLGKGAREDRLARHLELPLPAAEPAQGHIGGQPVQQCARRRQVVDRLGHEGPRHRRAVLGRPPRRPEVPGNQALDTDDLQGLHQLLLFFRVSGPNACSNRGNSVRWIDSQ